MMARWIALMGIVLLTASWTHGTRVVASVCVAGAADLSLTTGCNVPFFLNGIMP